jgi:hypothetical protein
VIKPLVEIRVWPNALSRRVLLAALSIGAVYAGSAAAQQFNLKLSGAQENPPVTTQASGTAQVTIGSDLSVSGTINTTGFSPTAAHIHTGAAGANGPVIVPMVKSGDNSFVFPAGAKLTPAQAEALKAGGAVP